MSTFHVLLYRMYSILKKSTTKGWLQRSSVAVGLLHGVMALVRRGFLPRVKVWVRVRSGLAKGVWMQIYLPGEGVVWCGEHETEVQSAISGALLPGAVFYDVGAHIGMMALGTARLLGDSGRVVAFDGDPENAERLRANSKRNGFEERIQVVSEVVWSRTSRNGIPFRRGAAEVVRSHGGVEADGNQPVLGGGEVITVPAVTLDDFIAAGAPAPQLIKVDVEGGEYEVLRGGHCLFALTRPFIIVEVHHQPAADLISAWLEEYEYRGNWVVPKEGFPRRLFAWPTEQDGATWMRAKSEQKRD